MWKIQSALVAFFSLVVTPVHTKKLRKIVAKQCCFLFHRFIIMIIYIH